MSCTHGYRVEYEEEMLRGEEVTEVRKKFKFHIKLRESPWEVLFRLLTWYNRVLSSLIVRKIALRDLITNLKTSENYSYPCLGL